MGLVWARISPRGPSTFSEDIKYVTHSLSPSRDSGIGFGSDCVEYDLGGSGKVLAIRTGGLSSLQSAEHEIKYVVQRGWAYSEAHLFSKNYHFVLSWNPNHTPSNTEMWHALDVALGELGATGHQYVAAIHGDTANRHLHCVLNRVHPSTHLSMPTHRSSEKLDASCRKIEMCYGLRHELGIFRVEDGVLVKNERKPKVPAWAAAARFDMLGMLNGPSPSWVSLKSILEEYGLDIVDTGRGFVFRDSSHKSHLIYASHLDRRLGKGKLQAVIGQMPAESLSKEGNMSSVMHQAPNGKFDYIDFTSNKKPKKFDLKWRGPGGEVLVPMHYENGHIGYRRGGFITTLSEGLGMDTELFRDTKTSVFVTSPNIEALEAAMIFSKQKWDSPLKVTYRGEEQLRAIVEIAARRNIEISNPEVRKLVEHERGIKSAANGQQQPEHTMPVFTKGAKARTVTEVQTPEVEEPAR